MIARLVKGKNTLDLASSPYALGDGFIPPALNTTFSISSGTSANVYGGGTLLSERFNNRQFELPVRILDNGTAAVLYSARRLSAFLSQYGDEDEPLFFEFSPYDIPMPLWGQLGAPLRYEIVTVVPPVGPEFSDKTLLASGLTITAQCELKPFPIGQEQRLASAMGGIFMDTLGAADGQEWGLRIIEAITNKGLNPVFSHATYNTGWTAGADLIVSKNIDKKYLFPGSGASVLLTAKSATVANNIYTELITAGNTNAHSLSGLFYRPDGAAVTSNDVQMYHGAAKTTVFQHLGNGLYLGYADNFAATAAATATGVLVKNGRSVRFLGYQFEEKAYHTPITFGDMLGSAWAGTMAESTSARTAGRVRLAVASDTFVNNLWAIHLVWRPDYASTQAGNRYMFSLGATNIRCYFNATDDKFYLTDNVNSASTAATAFSAADVVELIAVGGNSGLALYVKNQTTGNTYSGTNATYTIPAAASYIYIGTDDSAANHAGGIFQLFDTYNDDLTAAQVTALQTVVHDISADGIKIGDIPWLWTKDGDDVTDNSNIAGRNDYCVIGGIPGSVPTKPYIDLFGDAGVGIYLSVLDADFFINPSLLSYVTGSTTAVAQVAVQYPIANVPPIIIDELLNKTLFIIVAMDVVGSNLLINSYSYYDSVYVRSPQKSVTSGKWTRVTPSLPFAPGNARDKHGVVGQRKSTFGLEVVNSTGTQNVTFYYMQLVPEPVTYFEGASDSGFSGMIYDGDEARKYNRAQSVYKNSIEISGEKFSLIPNRINTVMAIQIDPTPALASVVITWNSVFVTPIWRLL